MIGDVYAYGMKLIDGMGSVMMRLAILPFEMLPNLSDKPIAAALLSVAALMASSGIIFILMQANETTNFMSPEGVEPGL